MSEQEMVVAKTVPLAFYYPGNLVSRYATNVIVQHTEHEFIISFFETHRPPIIGTAEDKTKQLDQIESIRAECVARIIIAPERMEEFAKVLQGNLENYRTKFQVE